MFRNLGVWRVVVVFAVILIVLITKAIQWRWIAQQAIKGPAIVNAFNAEIEQGFRISESYTRPKRKQAKHLFVASSIAHDPIRSVSSEFQSGPNLGLVRRAILNIAVDAENAQTPETSAPRLEQPRMRNWRQQPPLHLSGADIEASRAVAEDALKGIRKPYAATHEVDEALKGVGPSGSGGAIRGRISWQQSVPTTDDHGRLHVVPDDAISERILPSQPPTQGEKQSVQRANVLTPDYQQRQREASLRGRSMQRQRQERNKDRASSNSAVEEALRGLATVTTTHDTQKADQSSQQAFSGQPASDTSPEGHFETHNKRYRSRGGRRGRAARQSRRRDQALLQTILEHGKESSTKQSALRDIDDTARTLSESPRHTDEPGTSASAAQQADEISDLLTRLHKHSRGDKPNQELEEKAMGQTTSPTSRDDRHSPDDAFLKPHLYVNARGSALRDHAYKQQPWLRSFTEDDPMHVYPSHWGTRAYYHDVPADYWHRLKPRPRGYFQHLDSLSVHGSSVDGDSSSSDPGSSDRWSSRTEKRGPQIEIGASDATRRQHAHEQAEHRRALELKHEQRLVQVLEQVRAQQEGQTQEPEQGKQLQNGRGQEQSQRDDTAGDSSMRSSSLETMGKVWTWLHLVE